MLCGFTSPSVLSLRTASQLPNQWPSLVADRATLSAPSGAVPLFHHGWAAGRERRGLFSFFTSCFGSHGFVDRGLSVCVLWAWHEDSAGSVGESVEQNLTREHEGSLWRRLDWKKRECFSVGETSHSVFAWSSVTSCSTSVEFWRVITDGPSNSSMIQCSGFLKHPFVSNHHLK